MTPADGGLVTVTLLGYPLEMSVRSSEHHDGLMREFALLAIEHPDEQGTQHVSRRLLEVIATLTAHYGEATTPTTAQRDAAIERGEKEIDLVYRVPPSAADAVRTLDRALEEADEFCRAEQLLTLATPADLVAFRRWYVNQFLAQISGAPPVRWADSPEAAAPGPAAVSS